MADIKERHPAWFKMKIERRELVRQLPPEVVVNVLLACWDFLETGEKPGGLSHIESIAFSVFMPDIEETWSKYSLRVSNGSRGGRPKGENHMVPDAPGRPHTAQKQKQKKKIEEDPLKGEECAAKPRPTSELPQTCFGPELQAAFSRWLEYKRERREAYKPTGLSALVSQIKNHAARHGEQAVARLIEECMASGWRGIIWAKLAQTEAAKGQSGNIFAEIAREEGLF